MRIRIDNADITYQVVSPLQYKLISEHFVLGNIGFAQAPNRLLSPFWAQ
jgi:hypothetical protein